MIWFFVNFDLSFSIWIGLHSFFLPKLLLLNDAVGKISCLTVARIPIYIVLLLRTHVIGVGGGSIVGQDGYELLVELKRRCEGTQPSLRSWKLVSHSCPLTTVFFIIILSSVKFWRFLYNHTRRLHHHCYHHLEQPHWEWHSCHLNHATNAILKFVVSYPCLAL